MTTQNYGAMKALAAKNRQEDNMSRAKRCSHPGEFVNGRCLSEKLQMKYQNKNLKSGEIVYRAAHLFLSDRYGGKWSYFIGT